MAPTGVHKFSAYDGTDQSVFTTASLSPSANKLYLLWIGGTAATLPTINSVVGGGLTWTLVDSQTGGAFRCSLYRALSASPGAPAPITITWAGSPAVTACEWTLDEWDGVDTGGANGANAVVQVVKGSGVATATHTLTLAAFGSADNRPAMGLVVNNNTALTPEAGYSEAGKVGGSSPAMAMNSIWNDTTADTTPTVTSGANCASRMVAVELKAGVTDTALVVAGAAHAHTVDNSALTQAHVLVVQDAGHASGAENVLLTQAHLLTAADAAHLHTAENASLTQAFVLAGSDAAHAHTSDAVALVQAFLLAGADATHAHTAETPTLSQTADLVVADATHGHTVGTVGLLQAYLLAAEDTAHAHASENVELTGAVVLVVAGASHAHAADTVDLVQSYVLAIADATHSHTAENPALIQAHTITVAGADHAHTAENVDLAFGAVLVVADVAHAHAADNLDLVQAYVLAVADSSHSHTAQTLTLAQAYTLTVAGAAHAHLADSLVLIGGGPYQPAPAARRVQVGAAGRLAEPELAARRVQVGAAGRVSELVGAGESGLSRVVIVGPEQRGSE